MSDYAIKLGKHLKLVIPVLLAAALIFLASCGHGGTSQVYDVEHNGKIFTVDQANQTIASEGHIYSFEVAGNGGNVKFKVTYPDGSTYWWSQGGNVGYGGWSDDYDPGRYAPGDVLWDVLNLDRRADGHDSGKYIGLGLLLILLGAVNAAFPRAMWYIEYGWRYKDAEPSDMVLFAERAGGAIAVIAGVICLFV